MKLICTLTGAQVETNDDDAARCLIASGGFEPICEPQKIEEQPKKAAPRKTSKKKED